MLRLQNPSITSSSGSRSVTPHAVPKSSNQAQHVSKRSLLLGGIVVNFIATSEAFAKSSRGLNAYIKKKQLDPLETYVPVVLQARAQLVFAGEALQKDAGAARELLRTGPFTKLRDNIRALGEYATQDGKATLEESTKLVNGYFLALDSFDYFLYESIRDKKDLDVEVANTKLKAAVDAMDALIATVPDDIISKSREVLEVLQKKSSEAVVKPSGNDSDILEELL